MPSSKVLAGNEMAFGFGERRRSTRFQIERTVRCKSETGVTRYGRTVDISGSGVSFTTEDPPILGQSVELTVDWPVRLKDETHLKLVILGQVVRREPNSAAVAITNHEFRTFGSDTFFALTGS
jgi:hypothetical protein